MEREPKDVLKSYESSLEDLTFNSKPIINMLTMTADKHKALAPEIAELIESRVLKVRAEYKLPTIYLMDSIMKNLGGEYLQLFSRNIVRIFCHVFESLVDPKIRIALYKLRQTWSQFIPVKKLAAIDKHVNAIDPNWPITAKEDSDGPTIFVNPDFLKSKSSAKEKMTDPAQSSSPIKKDSEKKSCSDHTTATATSGGAILKTNSSVGREGSGGEQSIQDKRRQLLEQQRQKKIDTKIAMGLAPPSEETKKRQRSHSPNPSPSRRMSPEHPTRPRSASPTVSAVTRKPHQSAEGREDSDTGVQSFHAGGERARMESSAEKPVEKRPKLDVPSLSEGNIEPAVLKPIKQEMLELDDLPLELLERHKDYILKQAESKLRSGQLTEAQHKYLVGQIDQLYLLQKKKRTEQDTEESQSVQMQPCPPPQSQPHIPVHHQQAPSHAPFQQDQPHLPSQLPRKQPLLPHPVYEEQQPMVGLPVQEYQQPPPPKSYPDKHMHPSYHPRSPPHHSYNPPPPPPSHNVPLPSHSHNPLYHPRKFDNDFPPSRGHRAHVPPPHDYPPPHRHHPYREHRLPERPFTRGRPGPRRGRSRGGPPSGIHGGYPPPGPPTSRGTGGRGGETTSTLPVKDLFDQLVIAGILPANEKEKPIDANHSQPPVHNLPEISLTNSDLRRHHSSLVDLLHRGEPCTSCGQRFLPDQQDLYQRHLDWHYRENRMDKEGTKRTFRNWYLHPDDWLAFEEMSSGVPNEPVLSLEPESREASAVPAEEGIVSCKVLPGEGNEVCGICEEVLEQFWEEEEEEWHFKEALRSPGFQVYHVNCYEDSSVSRTNHSQDTRTKESAVDSTST